MIFNLEEAKIDYQDIRDCFEKGYVDTLIVYSDRVKKLAAVMTNFNFLS
jgi:hypothetical protein